MKAWSVVAFPVLGFLVLSIAMDEGMMGEHANGTLSNVLGVLGYLTILGVVLDHLREIVQFI